MKKLGLRAVAGSLALLLTASAFAPATTANAADMLITAKAPKTLVITADMVDDDGEVVISNENWDRIIVEKEVVAKNIYFDGVDVAELVVESGSKTKVQLWDVEAEKVTVQEPELETLTLKELLTGVEEEEVRNLVLDLYKENQAKNKKALKTAPSIVTKDGAKVAQVVARANAKLDLGLGNVGVVALEASDKIATASVTLSNYEGDVTYTGNAASNVMNLKNVNSVIANLKVEDSTATNRLYITAKNSVVEKAEIAGNAVVSVNAPVDVLEVSEKASAAQVLILDEVAELKVAANAAKVELTENAVVTNATIAGDKVNIGGKGQLKEAEVTGSGAYVATNGTKVEGENTYVPPVYVPPVKKINMVAYDGVKVTNAKDGSATISFDGKYKSAAYIVPESIDVNCIKGVKLGIETSAQFCLKLIGEGDVEIQTVYPGWGLSTPTFSEYKYDINPLKQKLNRIEIMSLNEVQPDLTVKYVEFDLYDVAPEEEERPLVYENKVYTFADLTEAGSNTEYTVDPTGVADITFDGQYKSVIMMLPEVLNASDYPLAEVKIFANTNLAAKVWKVGEEADNPVLTVYGFTGKIDLEKIAGSDFEKIAFMSLEDSVEQATIESITFIGSGNVGKEDPKPEDPSTPTVPEGGIECVANKWEVKLFNDVDLRDYAGKEVTFSFDMIKTGTKGDVLVHVQLNNAAYKLGEDGKLTGGYEPVKWEDYLTDEWKSYSYTYKVPAEFANKEVQKNPIYLGLRTDDKVDYSPYKFYIKNYKFVGTKAEGDDTPTATPTQKPSEEKVTVTIVNKPESTKLTVGDSITLKATASVSGSAITWASSNKEVATVDAGVVKAVSAGAVTITASCGDAKDSVAFTVVAKGNEPTVPGAGSGEGDKEEEKITLTIAKPESTKLTVGDKVTLKVTSNVTSSAITWETSDAAVATVDKNGLVTAVAAGKATITAKTGDVKDSVEFTVEAKKEVIKEFYLVKDGTFADKTAGSNGSADVIDCYLNAWTNGEMSGHNFADKLPEALKADKAVADKFKTWTGILEMVDYFEVEVTLTEWTAVEGKESCAPQAQVFLQYFGTGNNDGWGTWGACIGNVEGTPKTGVVKHSTSLCKDKTAPELSKLGVQMINAEPGTTLAGTYSIKVVLK